MNRSWIGRDNFRRIEPHIATLSNAGRQSMFYLKKLFGMPGCGIDL
jgi:hypothetical protein